MSTLLLRLAAPLQSWGDASMFEIRKTHREPTKSGVVGLMAAALGRKRDEDISDLARLRFGVRVDREGEILKDFQTVQGFETEYYRSSEGEIFKNLKKKDSYVTQRYYLMDAVFLVGVEGEEEFLLKIDHALNYPVFTLYLGRKSCPPTLPLSLGIRETDLETALTEEARLVPGTESLRMVLDGEGGYVTDDLPISFDPWCRQYGFRPVVEKFV